MLETDSGHVAGGVFSLKLELRSSYVYVYNINSMIDPASSNRKTTGRNDHNNKTWRDVQYVIDRTAKNFL